MIRYLVGLIKILNVDLT